MDQISFLEEGESIKHSGITGEDIRSVPGFENVSEVEAVDAANSIKELCTIIFFALKQKSL